MILVANTRVYSVYTPVKKSIIGQCKAFPVTHAVQSPIRSRQLHHNIMSTIFFEQRGSTCYNYTTLLHTYMHSDLSELKTVMPIITAYHNSSQDVIAESKEALVYH